MHAMTYLLAIFASLAAATGAALQHREVAEVPEHRTGGLALVLASLRRPGWLLGMAVLLAAPVFQFLALKVGTLSQVQPVLTTELLFLLGIIVVTHHQRPGRSEWTSSIAIVVGLVIFLLAAHPGGKEGTLSNSWQFTLAIGSLTLVGLLWLLGQSRHGWARAALFGSAAASAFAYQAAMSKSIGQTPADELLMSPGLYGFAITGLLGFVLFQHALRAGHVAASRAAMVIVNPMLSVVIGVVAFGETLAHTPLAIVGEVIGLAILLVGARQLSVSPLISADTLGGAGEGPDD
jgi:drug/metabolite transporter (DMT)-like permease